MQELAGRLTALDPEASASLKVIASFDALVAGGVGIEALVRAAAVLGGTIAGARIGGRTTRVDADGRVAPDGDAAQWPQVSDGDGTVWIERDGAAHANDAMILERLALAVAVIRSRRVEPVAGAVEVLIDGSRHADERERALQRLHLDRAQPLMIVASHGGLSMPVAGASTTLTLPDGLLRATIAEPSAAISPDRPAGVAVAASPYALAEAWHDARSLLRLASPRHPVVRDDELGALILLVRAYDPTQPAHPDVEALCELDDATLRILDELVAAESVRAAATALSLHHSTLQARHEALSRMLGYDPRSAIGRTRYETARLLSRLRAPSRAH